MTVVVENNISDLKKFRDGLSVDTILFAELNGLLKFINLNNKNISTVVLDNSVDPDKIPSIAQYIKQMFPHITTVEYTAEDPNKCSGFMYCIGKPFDSIGKTLLETLSGQS